MTHKLPILCSGLLLLALAACYDNDSPTAASQPRPGSATIVPDWGDAEGAAVRTLVMAYAQDGSLSPGSLSHENLTPGRHRAFAYTPAARHLAVEGGIAGINAGAGDVLPSVGELWTGHADFDVEEDRETAVTLPMQPRTRLLRLSLRIEDGDPQRVRSLTATLSGVRRWRVVDPVQALAATNAGTRADGGDDAGGTVRLDFALDAEGAAYTAAARLLGLVPGAKHRLRLTLTNIEGNPDTQEYDLTDDLAGFEGEGGEGEALPPAAFSLEGGITLPQPVRPQFGISGWTPAGDTEGGADMDVDNGQSSIDY